MKQYLLGYVTGRIPVKEEDAKKLTHIFVAFGKLRMDGSILSDHPILSQLAQIRSWNPQIKICLSLINNEGENNAFTTVCADPALRKAFAQSCVDVVTHRGFDGIDIDWEYPCVPSSQSGCVTGRP